jgi:long-chain acyl-CoA synthetase
VSGPETLPGLLEQQAQRRPRATAIRHKRLGIWQVVSWAEHAAAVQATALALDELGVRRGDRVAVIAENGPAWLEVDLATQATGAATVGVFPALSDDELAAAVAAAAARVAFCGDQEQVDRLLEQRERVPTLEQLIVFDTKGLHTPEYAQAPIRALDEVRERGRELIAEHPARYGELLAALSGSDVALVAFTSGTTGPARGVLLRHEGEIALARIVAERLRIRTADRAFSLLPLAHATARLFDAYVPLVAGSSINFAETPDTVATDIVELSPTLVVATPRLLERVRGDVELRIARAARLKRGSYRLAMRLMTSGGIGRSLGRALVGRFVVRKAGLGRLRYGGIAGSFVAPELLTWFWALGVPVREQYGQVETGGIVTTQLGGDDLGTAGPPLSDAIHARLDDSGELVVRTPAALVGYLGREDAPPGDGWYATGDVAQIDERGRIVPVARRNQLLTTPSGEEVSPAEIESTLKLSPYIASAVVVAGDLPYLSTLLELDLDAVADWARRNGIVVTSYGGLAAHEGVAALVGGEVSAANDRLRPEQRVQAFRILPRQLEDELTPTGKIRRQVVQERFAGLIEEMNAAGEPAVARSPAA